jgi:hypothetical protein
MHIPVICDIYITLLGMVNEERRISHNLLCCLHTLVKMSGQAGSSGGSIPKNPLLATGGPRHMHLVIYLNMACAVQSSAECA